MLHQELPSTDLTPLDGVSRWLVPALVGGAALTVAVLLWLLGLPLAAGLLAVVGVASVPVLKQ